MSTSQSSRARKRSNRPKSAQTPHTRPGAVLVDTAFEKQIIDLIKRFTGRSLLSSAVILIMCEYALQHSSRPREVLLPYATVSAFAVAFPYVRGASRTFKEIKQLGIRQFKAQKFADARFALDYFHRFGQMSFDRDGEAHFYLIRANIRLGDIETAKNLDLWMQKHRSKFDWAAKSTAAVQDALLHSRTEQRTVQASEGE